MGINLITDPNALLAQNIENGIPEYESYIPYVEMYVVRNGSAEYQIRQDGTTKIDLGFRETISLMGFDAESGLYTSKYTDDVVGEVVRENNDEGFGITNIDIEIKSKFVPYVNVKFLDIKGGSLLNPEQKKTNQVFGNENGSRYSVLFDYPPATYVLIMKGAYGKAVRYILHLLNVTTTFDSETANFVIDAKFVGKTFAPLSDIKMGWIKAAPFIFKETPDFSLDPSNGVNSFYEFSLLGKQLYDKLNEFSKVSEETRDLKKNNEDFGILKSLESSISNVGLDRSVLVNNITDGEQTFNNFTGDTVEKFLKISANSSNEEKILTRLNEHKTQLLSDEYRRIVNVNIAKDNDIYIKKELDEADKTTIYFYFVYTKYVENIEVAKNRIIVDTRTKNTQLVEKTENIVRETLGFEPNIGSVMKLLCDDVDVFFNKLRDAGDSNRSDGGFPTVTRLVTGTDGIQRETMLYPGSLDEYKNWKEVQFVESFCEVYLGQKNIESQLDEQKRLNEDGTKKLIPVSPYDTELFGSNTTLSYVSKNTPDKFLENLLKRYFISTQFTYKGFWDLDTSKRNVNFNRFLAESEAINIYNSLFDEKLIDSIISLLEDTNIINENRFLVTLDAYNINNPDTLQLTNNFISDNSIVDEYKIDTQNTIYSFKDNPNYKGLLETPTFNPSSDVIDNIDDKSPTKFLLDAVAGGFFNELFKTSKETPKVTKDNLLYFPDKKKIDNNFNSDYIDLNTTLSEVLLESFVDVSIFAFFGVLGGTKTITDLIIQPSRFKKYTNYAEFIYDIGDKNEKKGLPNFDLLETVLFSRLLSIDSLSIDGKFLYSGIIEMPNIFIYKIGKELTKEPTKYNLSQLDRDFFTNEYNTFKSKANTYLTEYNAVYEKQNSSFQLLENTDLFRDLFKQRFLVNISSFTFLNQEKSQELKEKIVVDQTKFFNLNKKFRNGIYEENLIPYSGDLDRVNEFFRILKPKLISLLKDRKNELTKQRVEFETKLKDNDVKSQLYYSFKLVYDRWIKGVENFVQGNEFSYPFNNGTSLYNKFKFVDRAYRDISSIMVVNFNDLIDYSTNSDAEVYGGISSFLSKNKFEFFPLPNFLNVDDLPSEWNNAFSILESTEISTEPLYTCMYVGGYSSTSDDFTTFNNDALIPKDMSDASANIFAFNVLFGSQNQTIFKDIQLSTSEHKETGESLKMMDNIFNNIGNSNTPTLKGQSLFEVYENRSYTTTITIPFGNMMIQPTQYFEILNVPLFNGVYIILEVKHTMDTSNRVQTTFSGYRIRKYISPIVTEPFVNVLGIFDDLNKITDNQLSSNVDSGGSFGKNTTETALKFNPSDELIRKEDEQTQLIVRRTSDGFKNNETVFNFTTQNINYTNVGITQKPRKG